MGSRKWMALVMLAAIMLFAACGSMGESDVIKMENELPAEAELLVEDEPPMETEKEAEILIYYSNSNADGLECEKETVAKVSPEVIIGHLAKRNIVSIDTKVNKFEMMEEDGRNIINLDLSEAFGEYLGTMGTSGEVIITAALTDTFLDAYGGDAIRITVDGGILETGHAVYDAPLTFVETNLRKEE